MDILVSGFMDSREKALIIFLYMFTQNMPYSGLELQHSKKGRMLSFLHPLRHD